MLYRWADHQLFPVDDGAILFGVDDGSLFLVDSETRELVGRRGKESVDPAAEPDHEREILAGLRDIRILVPETMAQRPRPVPEPADFPLETLVLEVAQDCNLRCRYCYAEGGAYGKTTRLLDPETARRAVRLLATQAAGRGRGTLILFGGEPLVNLEAVEAAVDEAEKVAGEGGAKLALSLTTNATLVTSEIAAFLHRHRVAVAVSMDGPADLHDANRSTASGAGSYQKVLAGASLLLSERTASVAARVTLVPEQWSRVEEVFDHLVALGFDEVGIAPASPIHAGLLPEPEHEARLLDGFGALASRFVTEAEKGRVLPFGNLIDLLARLHTGQTKSVSCGAGLGYLAADAGGNFFLCHRLTGEEGFEVGTLESGADPELIRQALDRVTGAKKELCRTCWARTLCSGGCHYENHLRGEHLGLSPESGCGFVLGWLKLGIETYARLRAAGADRVLTMLEKRAKC